MEFKGNVKIHKNNDLGNIRYNIDSITVDGTSTNVDDFTASLLKFVGSASVHSVVLGDSTNRLVGYYYQLINNSSATINVKNNSLATLFSLKPSQNLKAVLLDNSTADGEWYLDSDTQPTFGSGTDGDVTLSSGTTNLTRTMYYNNLTLSGNAVLNTAGFKIFVREKLTIQDNARISNDGANGNNATGNTPGSVPSSTAGVEVGEGAAGGAGATQNNNAASLSTIIGYGNAGGSGGAGGQNGTGTPGGSSTSGGSVTYRPEHVLNLTHLQSQGLFKQGGNGGAGGSGGANSLLATAAAGGGGGSGGGGGHIYIISILLQSLGNISVSGGNGGSGGSPAGSGTSGQDGSNGSAGHYSIFEIAKNTWTVS